MASTIPTPVTDRITNQAAKEPGKSHPISMEDVLAMHYEAVAVEQARLKDQAAQKAKAAAKERTITTYNRWTYSIPEAMQKTASSFPLANRIKQAMSWPPMMRPKKQAFVSEDSYYHCARCMCQFDTAWGYPPVCSGCDRVFECGFCKDFSVEDEDREVSFGKNKDGESVVVDCPYCRTKETKETKSE